MSAYVPVNGRHRPLGEAIVVPPVLDDADSADRAPQGRPVLPRAFTYDDRLAPSRGLVLGLFIAVLVWLPLLLVAVWRLMR